MSPKKHFFVPVLLPDKMFVLQTKVPYWNCWLGVRDSSPSSSGFLQKDPVQKPTGPSCVSPALYFSLEGLFPQIVLGSTQASLGISDQDFLVSSRYLIWSLCSLFSPGLTPGLRV